MSESEKFDGNGLMNRYLESQFKTLYNMVDERFNGLADDFEQLDEAVEENSERISGVETQLERINEKLDKSSKTWKKVGKGIGVILAFVTLAALTNIDTAATVVETLFGF